jgi:hypothetical protein
VGNFLDSYLADSLLRTLHRGVRFCNFMIVMNGFCERRKKENFSFFFFFFFFKLFFSNFWEKK